ncbi:MAG: hypothetical protein EPN46_01485 [Candidimonas sp.]|nr:MAG: hypothetical protein EPN77_04960 [Candidimonas sp.]TAM20790.1 MAG: hypothetical protein EPN62_15755 [Candidimonas sp.]TAM80465.1 MAG: hypothetical protein EPN46_01485 [Candidimonas sp.]
MNQNWIAVASADHVQRGREAGFMQAIAAAMGVWFPDAPQADVNADMNPSGTVIAFEVYDVDEEGRLL